MRGYFGIGIYKTKEKENVGTLWRSADNFGAAFIFTVGKRYQKQASDTGKAFRHIPLYEYPQFYDLVIPKDCKLIGVEQTTGSKYINDYKHPERAVYILGAEDEGLPKEVLEVCDDVIQIDTPRCLNVATAGSIIMFHRSLCKSLA